LDCVSSDPGTAFGHLVFEPADRLVLLERHGDVVEPFEQHLLARRVDLERDRAAIGPRNRLRFQIDGERRVRSALGVVEQQYLPDPLRDRVYYSPTEHGWEREISSRIEKLRRITRGEGA
jgi:hypothetical protein